MWILPLLRSAHLLAYSCKMPARKQRGYFGVIVIQSYIGVLEKLYRGYIAVFSQGRSLHFKGTSSATIPALEVTVCEQILISEPQGRENS